MIQPPDVDLAGDLIDALRRVGERIEQASHMETVACHETPRTLDGLVKSAQSAGRVEAFAMVIGILKEEMGSVRATLEASIGNRNEAGEHS